MQADFWDQRYHQAEYAYGVLPNAFLQQQLDLLKSGRILFAAEGEGRNAVHAARLGWQVSAFDISSEGRRKALQLAQGHEVALDYQVGSLEQLSFEPGSFDALALIYAHFPAEIKSSMHRQLATLLRPGGHLIFEAFCKDHLAYVQRQPQVGGPKDIDMLFSMDELRADFADFTFEQCEQVEVQLQEGLFHNGTGAVIRLFAHKNA